MPTLHDEVMFNGMRLGKGLSFHKILTSHLISDLSLLSGLMIACISLTPCQTQIHGEAQSMTTAEKPHRMLHLFRSVKAGPTLPPSPKSPEMTSEIQQTPPSLGMDFPHGSLSSFPNSIPLHDGP